jgi:FtsH-binding integral membrane protein
MEKIITIAICIIAFFALLGYIFSDKDEDRVENATAGGISALMYLISLLPTILFIAFIVYCVKSCS